MIKASCFRSGPSDAGHSHDLSFCHPDRGVRAATRAGRASNKDLREAMFLTLAPMGEVGLESARDLEGTLFSAFPRDCGILLPDCLQGRFASRLKNPR